MRKILLRGCNGKMGRNISELCSAYPDVMIVAGVDTNTVKLDQYPVYADLMEYAGPADVVVDFSSPHNVAGLLNYCVRRSLPIVLATTGYSAEQQLEIEAAAQRVPLFQSANMSLGVSLLVDLVRRAAEVLGEGYDIEIIERHHNQKVDAPSGTAMMLYKTLEGQLPYSPEPVYDRHEVRRKRGAHEIGIHAVRGGTIVGEHDVLFAGPGEVITLSHSAVSREVFAAGALRAALFMARQSKSGLYAMRDLLQNP